MHWHWTFVDILTVLILAVSTGFALTKGLAREVISLIALIGGLFLAAFFYPVVGSRLAEVVRTEMIADFIGFIAIFAVTLIIGALAAFLVNRFVKMAALEWIDHLLGGLYGFLRGWAVASVLVLALIAFPIRQNAVARSFFAPYLLAGARTAVLLLPREMKDRFHREYRKVLQAWNQNRSSA